MPKINNQVLRNTITTKQKEIDQHRAELRQEEVERLKQELETDGTVSVSDHQDTLHREVREYERAEKAEAQNKVLREERKADCTAFFYWWYNQPGSNTDQGYDQWLTDTEGVSPQGDSNDRTD